MGGFYLGCAMLATVVAIVAGLMISAVGFWMSLVAVALTALIVGLLYGGLELTRI